MLVSLLKPAAAATTKVPKTAVNAKQQLNSAVVVLHDKAKQKGKSRCIACTSALSFYVYHYAVGVDPYERSGAPCPINNLELKLFFVLIRTRRERTKGHLCLHFTWLTIIYE
jgi:hypothetical protein